LLVTIIAKFVWFWKKHDGKDNFLAWLGKEGQIIKHAKDPRAIGLRSEILLLS